MKRMIIFFVVMMVCIVLVSAAEAVSRKPPVVGKGCVGECGAKATVEYKVKAKISKMMIIRSVKSSLCPNTGAFAFLFKNGEEAANGSITTEGASIQTEAAPGDKIVAYVITYPLFNGIMCIRLGELNFQLLEHDLVQK